MIQHEPRCDQRHTPRQRCNGRMTPAADRLARLATEATGTEPREELARSAEERASELAPESGAVREAVATIDPPEPTVFVSREWNETADAVEQAYRPPAAPMPRTGEQSDAGRTAALVGAALGLGLLLLMMRRRGT